MSLHCERAHPHIFAGGRLRVAGVGVVLRLVRSRSPCEKVPANLMARSPMHSQSRRDGIPIHPHGHGRVAFRDGAFDPVDWSVGHTLRAAGQPSGERSRDHGRALDRVPCPHEMFAAGSNGAIQSAANTAAPNQIPTVLLGQVRCYGEYTAVIIWRDGQIQLGKESPTCASTVFSAKNSASKSPGWSAIGHE